MRGFVTNRRARSDFLDERLDFKEIRGGQRTACFIAAKKNPHHGAGFSLRQEGILPSNIFHKRDKDHYTGFIAQS